MAIADQNVFTIPQAAFVMGTNQGPHVEKGPRFDGIKDIKTFDTYETDWMEAQVTAQDQYTISLDFGKPVVLPTQAVYDGAPLFTDPFGWTNQYGQPIFTGPR